MMALLYKKKGDQDTCMQICEKILSMDAHNVGAFELKGDLYKTNNKIEEAFIEYSKAVQVNPESSSAISSLGDILKFKGKIKEALEHYKKALSINS